MNLAFSTKWPKKVTLTEGLPTFFISKIQKGLLEYKLATPVDLVRLYQEFYQSDIKKNGVEYNPVGAMVPPKLHTIRHGKRWKAGDKIHFCINNRSKNYHRFAPVIEVKSVQDIRIAYNKGGGVNVFIDGVFFHYQTSWGLEWDENTLNQMERLALNDGFPSVDRFFKWFDADFEGQIIHWTDLKY